MKMDKGGKQKGQLGCQMGWSKGHTGVKAIGGQKGIQEVQTENECREKQRCQLGTKRRGNRRDNWGAVGIQRQHLGMEENEDIQVVKQGWKGAYRGGN